MALLEVTQTKSVSATIRMTDGTAGQLDQYAHFIGAPADAVIEEALKHVFAKDREFQQFRETEAAKAVKSTLRVRKAPVVASKTSLPKPPARATDATSMVAGSKA